MPRPYKKAKEYSSEPKNVEVKGWTQVGKVWLTTVPLWDPKEKIWARLTYQDALAAAKRFNAELLGDADVTRLHDDAVKGLALELLVHSLPDSALKQKWVVKDKDDEKALLGAMATGVEWAHYHDNLVQAELDRLWDGKMRVANLGKHWINGAPAGRAYLKGWWSKASNGFIQGSLKPGDKMGPHDAGHHDYGTTTILLSRKEPAT